MTAQLLDGRLRELEEIRIVVHHQNLLRGRRHDLRFFEGREQLLRIHGLLEDVVDVVASDDAFFGDDGHDDHRCKAIRTSPPDRRQHVAAAHVREEDVEGDHIEQFRAAPGQRFRAGGRGLHVKASLADSLGEPDPVLDVVVDDQDLGRSRLRSRARPRSRLRDGAGEAGQHREKGAPLAEGTAHADSAALRLHQPLRQRQPEARARILLGRARVELLELREEPAEVLLPDADAGVLDFEPEEVRAFRLDPHRHPTFVRRELQRVG